MERKIDLSSAKNGVGNEIAQDFDLFKSGLGGFVFIKQEILCTGLSFSRLEGFSSEQI